MVSVGQMLRAVQFDGHPCLSAQQIDLHLAPPIESDRQFGVQAEFAGDIRQGIQPAVQERFRRAASTVGPLRVGGMGPGHVDKHIRQWAVHPIADQPPHAGGVILLPLRIDGNRKETAVGTVGTFDGAFVTQVTGPLVDAGRGVAALAGLAALEAPGVDVVAPTKEGTEQGYLGLGGGVVVHHTGLSVHRIVRCIADLFHCANHSS